MFILIILFSTKTNFNTSNFEYKKIENNFILDSLFPKINLTKIMNQYILPVFSVY